ncbi:glycosyltransferase [Patulibacter brassicae]|uniref:Glycosyltransferase n=1 Tax=Patulibacter brassicae TaxID=1705717 RepID=A0ABU4VNQ9_9ACTN|nr:glycosyltransferase [Patulibacter brassicae]MDX8153490.1 glycosyltransferase [Patulibacter brassicae]
MSAGRVILLASTDRDGGAEQSLVRLYRGLADRGEDVLLVGRMPRWAEAGLPIHPVEIGPKWSRSTLGTSLRGARADRRAFLDAVAGEPVRAYHTVFKREQVLLTRALARRAPVVWSEQGQLPSTGVLGLAQARAYALASRHVAGIAAVSSLVVRSLPEPARSRARVVHNGIDLSRYRPADAESRREARAALGVTGEGPVLAWTGRVDASKRAALAVRVAEQLPDATLLVAGDGTELAAVREAASRLPGRVHVLGALSDPSPVYRAADAFLFTSDGRGEGLPTVLIEAAATGLPIVGMDDGGYDELVRDAGGVLCAPEPAAIAAAVRPFLQRPQPREAALAWARTCSVDAMVAAFAALLDETAPR